jgi:hypothetical protein
VERIFDRVLGAPPPPATDASRVPLTGADDATIRRVWPTRAPPAPGEVRRMLELLKRDPTRVEATIFDTMRSEHCSYVSAAGRSRHSFPRRVLT